MVDLGTHETTGQFGTKRQRKVRLSFELPNEQAVFNEEKGEQPYIVHRDYTFSMHEKAALRLFLEGWRGKKFTDEEAKSFDIATLLKVPAMLNIMHIERNGRTYANIGSASRLPKGLQCPPQITPAVEFSLADFDEEVYDGLPEWLQKKIADSDEWKARVGVGGARTTQPAADEDDHSFLMPTSWDNLPPLN